MLFRVLDTSAKTYIEFVLRSLTAAQIKSANLPYRHHNMAFLILNDVQININFSAA